MLAGDAAQRVGLSVRHWRSGDMEDPAPTQGERGLEPDKTGWVDEEERAIYASELGGLSDTVMFRLDLRLDLDRLRTMSVARAEQRARALAEVKALEFLEGSLL
jgi:hypothetical protein